MTDTSYAFPTLLTDDVLSDVRARTDNTLLMRKGRHGLYCWNRRSNVTYLWSWEEVLKAYREECGIMPEKQEAV